MITKDKDVHINQGDIFKNVEYIESIKIENGEITVNKIIYPLAVVLTQECDLVQDYSSRSKQNDDKKLISIILAPMYNFEHFILGNHLSELNMAMRIFSSKKDSTENKTLIQNETPRYHYFNFGYEVDLPKCVVDFKHYFTVNLTELEAKIDEDYICSLSPLYRERLVQRFSNYLSRIGLPEK